MHRYLYALTLLFFMGSPVWAIQVVNGTYTGDGLDNKDIVMGEVCQPVAVFVKRDVGTRDLYARFSSMGANVSKEVSGAIAEATDAIKVLNVDGFRLGTGASVNFSTGIHWYTAICDNGAQDVALNTWAGDNNSARTITISPAFTPELVIILQSGTGAEVWRGATSHSGDSASRMNALLGEGADNIQAFGVGSFEVGVGQNAVGTTYYSIAFKSNSGVATGTFAGDTNDDRAITAVASPKMVVIKGNSTTREIAYRIGSIAGDLSFNSIDASAANIIQSMTSTGFTVGTHTAANENGVNMRWFALTNSGTRRGSVPIFFP